MGEVIISYPQAVRQAGHGTMGLLTVPEGRRRLLRGSEGCPVAPGDSSNASQAAPELQDLELLEIKREMAQLVVHGVLHLLGFDHEASHEEAAMRAKENEILSFIF